MYLGHMVSCKAGLKANVSRLGLSEVLYRQYYQLYKVFYGKWPRLVYVLYYQKVLSHSALVKQIVFKFLWDFFNMLV